jgi:hypothetical protein
MLSGTMFRNNRFSYKQSTIKEKKSPRRSNESPQKISSKNELKNQGNIRPKTDPLMAKNPFIYIAKKATLDDVNIYGFHQVNTTKPAVKIRDIIKKVFVEQYKVFDQFCKNNEKSGIYEVTVD